MSGLDTIIQQHYQMAILVQKLYNGVGVLAFMPAKFSSNISTYVLLRKYTRGPINLFRILTYVHKLSKWVSGSLNGSSRYLYNYLMWSFDAIDLNLKGIPQTTAENV